MVKKVLFWCCACLLALMGAAHAAVDNTSMYGTYFGTLSDEEGTRSVTLTIGDDASKYDTEGDSFYIYVSPDEKGWSISYTNEDNLPASYNAALLTPTSFFFSDSSPAWTTMGAINFLDDLFNAFTLLGSSTGFNDQGSYSSSAISGSWTRATPIPGALWLLGTGLFGLVGLRRRRN